MWSAFAQSGVCREYRLRPAIARPQCQRYVLVAIETPPRCVRTNLIAMALWGVAISVAVGSPPLLIGLAIITAVWAMRLLRHATWHLYRALVQRIGPLKERPRARKALNN
jgi:hypothetical protein